MKRSLFLLALETSAKTVRSGFAAVGALVDCGMPGPQVRDALWLNEAEEEIEVWEAPLSADFHDEARPSVCHTCDWAENINCSSSYHQKSPVAMQGAVEGYPPAEVPPASAGADLTHLAQCLRDAVGDYYDFAPASKDPEQFPFWHEDGLIDAFDWEGATTAFMEDIVRKLIVEK